MNARHRCFGTQTFLKNVVNSQNTILRKIIHKTSEIPQTNIRSVSIDAMTDLHFRLAHIGTFIYTLHDAYNLTSRLRVVHLIYTSYSWLFVCDINHIQYNMHRSKQK